MQRAGPSFVQLKCGMGPRVEPSHSSQPIAQPLLNHCMGIAVPVGEQHRGCAIHV